jgi:hypothetical protein
MSQNTTANNWTEIAFILDRSGSMQSIRSGTMEGYNSFIFQQKEENDNYPVRFSLTLFSSGIEEVLSSIPVNKVMELDDSNYRPSGNTALLDAIGTTINNLGKRLADTPETDRPGKVIVAIMTDGEENSSRQFTWDQISEMIKHQTEVYKWQFLFLGANQDAIATASRMNIDKGSSSTYFQNSRSSRIALRAVTRSVSSMKAGMEEKPLAELYAEEDAMDPSDK